MILSMIEAKADKDLLTSYSRQRTLLRCPKRFEYNYVKNIRRIIDEDKFLFGSAVHEFLDAYYGSMVNAVSLSAKSFNRTHSYAIGKKAFRDYIQNNFPDTDEANEQAILAEKVIENYHDWSAKNDDFIVLGTEVEFDVDLGSGRLFRGFFDMVVQINDKIWVMEHKTANRIQTEHIERDSQVSSYIWAARKKGIPLEGVIYNTLRKAVPEKPRLLKNGTLSKARHQNVTYETYLEAIHENGMDEEDYEDILEHLKGLENPFFSREYTTRTETAIENTELDILQTEDLKHALLKANVFPRNITRDCSWDCPFAELCLLDMEGSDTEHLFIDKYRYILD